MEVTIELSLKSNIAFRFLDAAVEFSSKANLFEKENKIIKDDYYHYVISSIILSVSFLEANINELYSRIADKDLNLKNDDVIISLWSRGIPRTARYSILDKYEILLDVVGATKLDTSRNPYQNITALIKLRNALVHFEPEWTRINEAIKKESSLEKLLKGKFLLSPYWNEKTQPFFPYVCLSAGCSYWAVKSSAGFIEEYYKLLNIEMPSKKILSNIFNKIYKISV